MFSFLVTLGNSPVMVDPTPLEGMSDLLATLALIVTQIMTWVTSICTTIVSTPFLLLTTGFLVLGGAIGIFGRLLSRN